MNLQVAHGVRCLAFFAGRVHVRTPRTTDAEDPGSNPNPSYPGLIEYGVSPKTIGGAIAAPTRVAESVLHVNSVKCSASKDVTGVSTPVASGLIRGVALNF